MSDDYSVSELAQIVAPVASFPKAPTEADVELAIRRLRHWTLAGALTPIGEPHSGTGKHRRYDDSAIYSAAVLTALAENDQPIGTLIAVGQLIRNLSGPKPLIAGKMLVLWNQALARDGEVFLVMGAGAKEGQQTAPNIYGLLLRPQFQELLLPSGVFVNLTSVFSRLSQ
jgi:hypothetical protein